MKEFFYSQAKNSVFLSEIRKTGLALMIWQIFAQTPNSEGGYQKIKFLAFLFQQGSLPEIKGNPIQNILKDNNIEIMNYE